MAFVITGTQQTRNITTGEYEQIPVRWNNYWEEADLPWCKRYKTRKLAEEAVKRLVDNREFKKVIPFVVEE